MGPLFRFLDGCPVSCPSLDPKQYKGHSFRTGAATHAAQVGFSENAIQNMGRWKSDAVKRYIHIGSFSV